MSKYDNLQNVNEYLIYLRKSRQDNPNETVEEVLAKHEKQLQDYAVSHFGAKIPQNNVYREVVSGETIEDRPQINEVFNRLQAEDIQGVLVVETSRLTRGDLLDCGTVVHLFRYTNTKVITLGKTYDLADKYDRKFFEMELTKGNDYLEYTKEILQRGRLLSRQEGNFVGASAPYGYDRIKIGKNWTLAINENEAPYVKLLFEKYAQGQSLSSIARELEAIGMKPRKAKHIEEGTLKTMLENVNYTGKIRVNFRVTQKVYEDGKLIKKRNRNKDYEIVDGKHEPIISQELWLKVQDRIGKGTREKFGTELVNVFAGLMRCPACDKAINMVECRGKKKRLRCRSKNKCGNQSHDYDEIVQAVVTALKCHLTDFELKLDKDNRDIATAQKQAIFALHSSLNKLEKKQEELYDLLENGIYTRDVFVVRNKKLQEEREQLEQALEQAEKNTPTIEEYENKTYSLHKAIDLLQDNTISVKEKNIFLKDIIKVIWYTKMDDEIKIDIELR